MDVTLTRYSKGIKNKIILKWLKIYSLHLINNGCESC